jgi:hypothetical protein
MNHEDAKARRIFTTEPRRHGGRTEELGNGYWAMGTVGIL